VFLTIISVDSRHAWVYQRRHELAIDASCLDPSAAPVRDDRARGTEARSAGGAERHGRCGLSMAARPAVTPSPPDATPGRGRSGSLRTGPTLPPCRRGRSQEARIRGVACVEDANGN